MFHLHDVEYSIHYKVQAELLNTVYQYVENQA